MRALVTGVLGQDGSYLAQLLAAEGHDVYGVVRGQHSRQRDWLQDLIPGIRLIEADLLDQSSLVVAVAEADPHVVWNLAAISAPALAWRQPALCAEVTGLGLLRLVEAVRLVRHGTRIVQASSLATHGPYGAAKAYAHAIAADYRKRGMDISCAVMGGHHSPRRSPEFLTRKVSLAVARIAAGDEKTLRLGDLSRRQDWGWAPDFARALAYIAELDADDYVLSTGDPAPCEEWVAAAFGSAGLDWRDHVEADASMTQPTDVPVMSATPDERLHWSPTMDWRQVAAAMVATDREAL